MAVGRPLAQIDWDYVAKLCQIGSPATEIAATLGLDPSTIYDRCEKDNGMTFSRFTQKNKAKGENLLRNAQFKNAIEGNTTMQIWLGKQRLEQREPSNKELEALDAEMKKEFASMKCELENKDIEIQGLKAKVHELSDKSETSA